MKQSSALGQSLQTLNPAYFALVMATGIVSIACQMLGMKWIARALFYLNIVAFPCLLVLTVARLVIFSHSLLDDLIDHKRGVGFLTMVAASCVLGSQFLLFTALRPVAVALWYLGIVLWLVLTYTIFTTFVVERSKPTLADGIHGGWLLAVVATQSVAVLGVMLAAGFGLYREQVLFLSLIMWLGGGMIYIWIISLIFYRYTFFPVDPSHLDPLYWVNMGAMAISTFAGTMLIAVADESLVVEPLAHFLKGFTLLFWATATLWVPMLVILAIWRHLVRRVPFTYDPLYWGAVFPIGMYTVCTLHLAQVFHLPFLMIIPKVFIILALAAWTATFAGMARRVLKIGTIVRQ